MLNSKDFGFREPEPRGAKSLQIDKKPIPGPDQSSLTGEATSRGKRIKMDTSTDEHGHEHKAEANTAITIADQSTTIGKSKAPENPLLIKEILHHVLKYLDHNKLLPCRLVSKFWNEVGTSILKDQMDKVTIVFTPLKNVPIPYLGARVFLDMKSESELEFPKAIFSNFPMGMVNNKIIAELWNVLGPELESLALDFEADSKELTSSQLGDILVNRAPFLTELRLLNLPNKVMKSAIFPRPKPELELELTHIFLRTLWGRDIEMWRAYSSDFLRDLFMGSKKLQSLCVTSNFDSEESNCEMLRCLTTHGHVDQLTEITFDKVDDAGMSIMAQGLQNCQLKSVDFKCLIGGETGLQEFLNSHAATLESLKFHVKSWSGRGIIFPVLKNLKELAFGSYLRSVNSVPLHFGSLDYGYQFPVLKTLKITDSLEANGLTRSLNLEEIFPARSTPCATLKNLDLPPLLSSSSFEIASNLFPNVMKLGLEAQEWDLLDQLWTNWLNLKTLGICLNFMEYTYVSNTKNIRSMDAIFTGIPRQKLKKLKQRLDKFGPGVMNEEKLISYQTHGSIVNLKQLTDLVLHDGGAFGSWSSWTPPSMMTDLTGIFGFCRMESLEHLWIEKIHEVVKMTPSCLSAVEKKMGNQIKPSIFGMVWYGLPNY